MNELEEFEVELRRLEPRAPSVTFKQSLMMQLRDRTSRTSQSWPVWAAGALAAACLAALLLWSQGPVHRFYGNGHEPAAHVATEQLDPSVLAYRHVFNRNPAELNSLLDRQSSLTLAPSARGGPMRAFRRSDIELYR
jgi:hypothetical protein